MDKSEKIKMLEKVRYDLNEECWLNDKADQDNKCELIAMSALAKRLQKSIDKETFKKLLFDSFYDITCNERIFDDEVDNIWNSLKKKFKFSENEWKDYVEGRKEKFFI